jgi:hypothetical protein
MCYGEDIGAEALAACEAAVASYYEYGADCAAAFEEFMACLSLLNCEEFADPNACSAEEQAVGAACN